ncbi:MAG: hypothetical protein LBF78_13825 [Treponema sp.]|jgi:hypothetical protein|nr:hypothetical protein [Treponema sp.]
MNSRSVALLTITLLLMVAVFSVFFLSRKKERMETEAARIAAAQTAGRAEEKQNPSQRSSGNREGQQSANAAPRTGLSVAVMDRTSIDDGDAQNFPSIDEGYTSSDINERYVKNIIIHNASASPRTGAITISLAEDSANHFNISRDQGKTTAQDGKAVIDGIDPGEDVYVILTPRTGLSQGTYTAVFNVSDGGRINLANRITLEVGEADPNRPPPPADQGQARPENAAPAAAPKIGIRLTVIDRTSINDGDAANFPALSEGYIAEDLSEGHLKRIIIQNGSDGAPTGPLTAALSGGADTQFALSGDEGASFNDSGLCRLDGIEPGAYTSVIIKPKIGLRAGTYKTTLTVTNGKELEASHDMTLKVIDALRLSPGGTFTFPQAKQGYSAEDAGAQTVTIINTGDAVSGSLQITMLPSEMFELSSASAGPIPVGGTASFTVKPRPDLPANPKPYAARISVSDRSRDITVGLTLNFSVVIDTSPKYGVTLSVLDRTSIDDGDAGNFPPLSEGYTSEDISERFSKQIVIHNSSGNQPTGPLTAVISGGENRGFDLFLYENMDPTSGSASAALKSLGAGEDASVVIMPKPGLPSGVHGVTLTVSGDNGIRASVNITLQVKAAGQ